MAAGQLGAILHRLLVGERQAEEGSDYRLLDRFVADQDEAAFAALVERFGRLVLDVCRSVLHQEQDAEDAFQATFLVLARKASSIRQRTSLASWLHGVALRTALKARRARWRRRRKELLPLPQTPDQPVSEAALRELQSILHEEIERLPEKYRAPFVLCCLQGKSRAEAAQQLGWKDGTVSGRIAQARALLQSRLPRRGVALPAAVAATLTPAMTAGAVPVTLSSPVVRAAVTFAGRKACVAVSVEAARLATGVLQTMFVEKLKLVAGVALALALVLGSGGLLAFAAWQPREGPSPAVVPPAREVAAQAEKADRGDAGKELLDAFGDRLPAGVLARMGSGRLWHAGPVHRLAFTASGKLASAGADSTVRLWDSESGKELMRLAAGEAWVRGLAVSRDEKLLAAGGDAVYIWETSTGKRLHLLQGGKGDSYAVAFSPDGTRLVSGDGDNVFRLWDTASGQLVRTFSADATFIPPVAFSPDGKLLATAHGQTVRLWDPATGKEIRSLRGHTDTVYALAFSPDSKTLASGSVDRTIRLCTATTGELIRSFKGHTHQVLSVAFAPDGKTLASAGGDNLVRVWDVAAGKERLQIRQGLGEGNGNVNCVAFSPDGATLAAGSNHGRVRLWDAATGKEKQPARGHEGNVTALAFTPDGKRLLSGCFSGTILGWDAATGKELRTYSRDTHRVFALALSPDGDTLAAGCELSTFAWKTATGAEVLKATGGLGARIGFLPQGRLLASDGWRECQIWDLRTGKSVAQAPPAVLTTTPDGQLVYQQDHSLFLRDPAKRQDRVEFKLPVPKPPQLVELKGQVLSNLVTANCAAVSPDGKLLAAASQARLTNNGEGVGAFSLVYDESIHLWELATGKLVQKVSLAADGSTGRGRIDCLAFSPDGRTLAGGGRTVGDQRIPPAAVLFWDVRSGKEVYALRIPRLPGDDVVACLAFSPDGKTLATGGCDTTVLIWQLPPALASRAPEGKP
jgi:RNA polymerase sigma factor (sigma-70 family)